MTQLEEWFHMVISVMVVFLGAACDPCVNNCRLAADQLDRCADAYAAAEAGLICWEDPEARATEEEFVQSTMSELPWEPCANGDEAYANCRATLEARVEINGPDWKKDHTEKCREYGKGLREAAAGSCEDYLRFLGHEP